MHEWLRPRLGTNALLILCVLALVYASLVYAPYRLVDDNWLLRGGDAPGSYPGLDFISVVQGRPVFAVQIWLSRALAHVTGSEIAIAVLRGLAILGLAYFVWLLAQFVKKCGMPPVAALVIAIGAGTLPPFEIYLGAGPWLMLPVLFSTVAVALLFERPSLLNAGAAIGLFGLSFATYQATPFIAIPLVAFAWVMRGDRNAFRAGVLTVGCLFAALAIYYLLWRFSYLVLIGGVGDNRYSPTSVVHEPLVRAAEFWTRRVPQALQLWNVSDTRRDLKLIPLAILIAGVIVFSVALFREKGARAALSRTFLLILLFCTAITISDFAGLVSPLFITSYTTLIAMSLCIYLGICWSVLVMARALRVRPELGLAAICVVGIFAAQATVIRLLVVPLNAEALKFRLAVQSYVAQYGGAPRRILIYARPMSLRRQADQEFCWENLQLAFYAHWFALNQLRDLGYSDDVEVTVREAADGNNAVYPSAGALPPSPPLIFDARNP